jgi:hypothetical protein
MSKPDGKAERREFRGHYDRNGTEILDPEIVIKYYHKNGATSIGRLP